MIDRLLELNDEARSVLSSYKNVVRIDWDRYYVFSDIHGYVRAAEKVKKLLSKGERVITLGDYTGSIRSKMPINSIKTLMILYESLIEYDNNFIMLRGNHEDQSVHYLPISTLLREIHGYGAENVNEIEEELMKTMSEMPLVAFTGREMLMHGGIPVKHLNTESFLEELEKMYKPFDVCKDPYYEIVWNGPSRTGKRTRGISFNCLGEKKESVSFGLEDLEKARKAYGFKYLITGHLHPVNGYKEYLPGNYVVCSSYASFFVRRPGYLLVENNKITFVELGFL